MIPDRITFRPGPLAVAMSKRLATLGETPSEYIRRLVADDLGKKPPEMKEGNPQGFAAVNGKRKRNKRKAKR